MVQNSAMNRIPKNGFFSAFRMTAMGAGNTGLKRTNKGQAGVLILLSKRKELDFSLRSK